MLKESGLSIREATRADSDQIKIVLRQAHLSTDDLLVEGTRYWLAEDANEQPVGTIGLELGNEAALLRSVAVIPAQRGQGIGAALVQQALAAVLQAGYQRIYLFSTGSGVYWQRSGFREVPVVELVASLPDAPQVRRYNQLGLLPTEVAWRLDLAQ
ncbi:GNAT family N-acetyltransferase [Tengunoibacter tsumagoiensis]|uniref:GNAT family N-acetyltransferase n=1 Tax=Tengunoibacter tsumagoiensis TaxID=2014871 RepID=A0A402A1T6_9CHLR|nr:GNAT family N-acetyltransferase [Tengunoibacter tsumagoiensis]GCE13113.1 GNAT family N-acetyltransferase [Tengunoibacter tsumagoiensis]